MTTEEVLNELKEVGLKLTKNRQAIVELFVQTGQALLTPKDVFEQIKKEHPKVSFDTVYRTISMLEDHNIIEQINLNEGGTKFRFTCQSVHHHHLVCMKCGGITVLEECPMKFLKLDLKKFKPVKHQFEIYGYCTSCIG